METGTHHPEPFGRGAQAGTEDAKQKAEQLTRTARDRAMATVDRQKEALCGLLERTADSVHDDPLGRYASEYARRGAEFLRRQSANELYHSARRSFRERPALVLSAAFVAGLALARLVKGSTGDGRRDERFERGPSGDWYDPRRVGAPGYGQSPHAGSGMARGGYAEGSWASPDPTHRDLEPGP